MEYTALPIARLGFGDGGPTPMHLDGGKIRVGSAADNDIVLDDEGIAAHHLSLESRYRCWMLRVEPGAERVHVNARPVRELALLRLGDSISVGGRKLYLLPADDSVAQTGDTDTTPGQSAAPTVTGMRCVAGPLSGRFLPMPSDLLLDQQLLAGTSGCLRLRAAGVGATFELIDSDGPTPSCNGVLSMRGCLANGDQLAWGRHRFVLEARPRIAGSVFAPRVAAAVSLPTAPEPTPTRREVAWLLGMATLLAVTIAVLLLLRG